jgi:hypothetical protein
MDFTTPENGSITCKIALEAALGINGWVQGFDSDCSLQL